MIPFVKMHGIGNDFVMLDTLRDGAPQGDLAELSRRMNDRRFGIGGDGLILVERGDSAPFRMRMLNPDGSESEMCGNGVRCFMKLLHEREHTTAPSVPVETGAGVLQLEMLADGQIRVDMGPARLTRGEIGMAGPADERFLEAEIPGFDLPGTAVSMGNPHLVLFVPDVQAVDLETLGPQLERHPLFPARVNVHFVQVVDRGHLIQRTWERGAGITLACGTGACACGVAAFLSGRADRGVQIDLPGGRLTIETLENGNVMMTGPAETVYEGEYLLA